MLYRAHQALGTLSCAEQLRIVRDGLDLDRYCRLGESDAIYAREKENLR